MTKPTRERIIKELLYIAENSRSKGEVCRAAAEMLEKSRWISVEEKLPETNGDVIICFDRCGADIGRGWYDKKYNAWVMDNGFMCCYNVTHWMALPEPPKEG
jgi:hypothetical protein